jgi:hypothetical protein
MMYEGKAYLGYRFDVLLQRKADLISLCQAADFSNSY